MSLLIAQALPTSKTSDSLQSEKNQLLLPPSFRDGYNCGPNEFIQCLRVLFPTAHNIHKQAYALVCISFVPAWAKALKYNIADCSFQAMEQLTFSRKHISRAMQKQNVLWVFLYTVC